MNNTQAKKLAGSTVVDKWLSNFSANSIFSQTGSGKTDMSKKPAGSKPESEIQQEIQLAFQQEWPTSLILRQNTGAMKDSSNRLVRFGVPGQADLRCVIDGFAVEVECKTEQGKQSDAQRRYEKAVSRAGGIYLVCTDAEDCVNAARTELSRRRST